MMRKAILLFAAATLAAATFASDGAIGPGSPAPAMDVKAWFKGAPVNKLNKDKLYVVEFWATWCGPCKQSIPHLTELAKKNKDVTFVGVSIWEDNQDGNIQKFVNDMGANMDYHVGWSSNKEGMAKTWMQAAGQNGIPSAFIIKGGQIQWIGHPMEMEGPLGEVKSGKFDMKAFKVKFDEQAEQNRQQMAASTELRAIMANYNAGKTKEAKEQLDALVQKFPKVAESAESIRFGWLAKEDPNAWEAKADELGKAGKWMPLMDFAMSAMQAPNADMAMPCKAVEIAVKCTAEKDPIVLYYAGVIYDKAKEYKKGLDAVTKALAVLPNSEMKDNADFKAALEGMQKSLSQKAGN